MAYEVSVKIAGTVPLLQHRYQFKDELQEATTRKTGRPDYDEQWRHYLYVDDSGSLYHPADHVLGALIKAAGNFQITGRSKKTYRELVKSAVVVTPDAIPLGKREPDFIHRARVIVNRSAIERLRPAFRVWSLSFSLVVSDDQLQKPVLYQVLQHAALYCGIGDYRPRFGRFRIEEFR